MNQRLGPGGISRASVINFLEDMASMGVLNRMETTGKGGYRGVYSSEMDESGFKKLVARTVIEALVRSFLDETKQAMEIIS